MVECNINLISFVYAIIFLILILISIGTVFGASLDALRQVPCLLTHLADPESKFRTKELDGTKYHINILP